MESYGLDAEQKKAVYTSYKNTLIVAAPGSGKTTVIINRVSYLINEKKIPAENIVVITFTKAAAEDMKKRYLSKVNSRSTPFFGTFHSLFYRILKDYYGSIKIIDGFVAHKLIGNFLYSYLDEVNEEKTKDILNDISLFKSKNNSFDKFSPSIDKSIFLEGLNIYENYKAQNKLLDFDDLQIKCKELLKSEPLILKKYKDRLNYILVDEFQDCDEMQIEILQMLNGNNSLFAVGDEDQCIYGFRGSKPECMVDFQNYFLNGQKIFLGTNYRSAKNITAIAKNLIGNNLIRNSKSIVSWKRIIGQIKAIRIKNENEETKKIVDSISELKSTNQYNYSDNAILYRTKKESRSLIDSFIKAGVPFYMLDGTYNFFKHFICQDILAYLKLCVEPSHLESFIIIINKPYRYVSKLNILRLKRNEHKEDCFEVLTKIKDVPNFQVKELLKLKRKVNSMKHMDLVSVVDFIVYKLYYGEYLTSYSSKVKIKIEDLYAIVDEFKEVCSRFKTISELLDHVEKVKIELETKKTDNSDHVIFSTMHGVKGMEFKNVFIINCNEEFIPHSKSTTENLEEERRVFYVAITRAIDNLYLYSVDSIKGKAKAVSRFVDECMTPYT